MNSHGMRIGICGPAKHGKGATADALQRLSGNAYRVLPLAAPLKGMLETIIPKEHLYDPALKEVPISTPGPAYGYTARYLMQTLGTEWGRGIHERFWLDAWKVRFHQNPDAPTIVDDVRFPNEARMLQEELGFKLIRVVNPRLQVPLPTTSPPPEVHAGGKWLPSGLFCIEETPKVRRQVIYVSPNRVNWASIEPSNTPDQPVRIYISVEGDPNTATLYAPSVQAAEATLANLLAGPMAAFWSAAPERAAVHKVHGSEAHALSIPVDYEIFNEGTLEDLQDRVAEILVKESAPVEWPMRSRRSDGDVA